MHQSLPALSQRVSALEAQGYVERVPDPDDRRVIGVCVTPEGRTVMEVAYRRFGSILSRSIDYLGPQNFETLLHLLGELAIALEQAVAAQEEERESDSK
jgi:DNA-binding MarR family transcriptional regulator